MGQQQKMKKGEEMKTQGASENTLGCCSAIQIEIGQKILYPIWLTR